MRALTLSGPGDLFSGRDATTQQTSSHVTVLKLNSLSGARVESTSIESSGIVMLLSYDRCLDASAAFLPTLLKIIKFFCYNCQVFGINWTFFVLKRNSTVDNLPKRTRVVLMKSNLFKSVSPFISE